MRLPAYKADLIELMARSGVLMFGDFTTKSGRQTPYFVNTGNYGTGAQADALSVYYAELISEKLNGEFDCLFGPAYKGIPLCTLTAAALWRNHGININYCFNRKEAKDHGEGGVFVGYQPAPGDRVLIIEDVITAGTAVREVMPLIQSAGAVAGDMVISVNRMEKGYHGLTAADEIKRDFGITVHSIVTVHDILSHLYNREVGGKVYIDGAMKAKMEDYMKQYCV
jgi:orotate phosphoribosyltransferase